MTQQAAQRQAAQHGARSPGLEEWRPLDEYHAVLRLIGHWCWDQAARGNPPPSPGGFARRVGIPRKLMSSWTATPPSDRLPGFTLDRAVEIATYTHLPVRDLLTAGGVLGVQEPLYTREDALRYVAESLAAQQAAHLDLTFEPTPVIAWLNEEAAAVARTAAGETAPPRKATADV